MAKMKAGFKQTNTADHVKVRYPEQEQIRSMIVSDMILCSLAV